MPTYEQIMKEARAAATIHGRRGTSTSALTPVLCTLLQAVHEAREVTLTLGGPPHSRRVIDAKPPEMNNRPLLLQAALLGYLARAQNEDVERYTVSGLGRSIADLLPPRRNAVHRKDACPNCGVAGAVHWVEKGESKREIGFWLCDDEEDDGIYK